MMVGSESWVPESSEDWRADQNLHQDPLKRLFSRIVFPMIKTTTMIKISPKIDPTITPASVYPVVKRIIIVSINRFVLIYSYVIIIMTINDNAIIVRLVHAKFPKESCFYLPTVISSVI